MNEGSGLIAKEWGTADGKRKGRLERIKELAALTKPWILPYYDDDHTSDNDDLDLIDQYQSLGPRGITNLEGQMLGTLFPVDEPFVILALPEAVKADPKVTYEEIEEQEQKLFLRTLVAMAALEEANIDEAGDTPLGFRTAKRQALSQILVTGDVLERLDDDLRLTVFRADNYTTDRDTTGRVLCHMVREHKDLGELTQDQVAKLHLSTEEIRKLSPGERCKPLYTMVKWQPWSKTWVITQEINGHEIASSEETVSPYFSTPFELTAGENYGRGFTEQNRGDLRSLNDLTMRMLDFAAAASRIHPVIDGASEIREKDLNKPSGTPFRGRVVNGVVQDLGFMKVDKMADFQVVAATRDAIRKDLGAAMLLENESVRDSERTTAFEVREVVIRQLQGALGGFYAPVADRQQKPMARRLFHVLEKKKVLLPLPAGTSRIVMHTGIAALSRAAKAAKVIGFADIMAKLGDATLGELNLGVLVSYLARLQSINVPGLIKTPDEKEAERQTAVRNAAAAQAIQSGGRVIENMAAQAAAQGTA